MTSTPKPRFEVFPDRAGSWRFRLKAKNGEVIASSEAYATPSNVRRAIRRLQAIAPTAELRMVVTPAMALDPDPEATATATREAHQTALERLAASTDRETLTDGL